MSSSGRSLGGERARMNERKMQRQRGSEATSEKEGWWEIKEKRWAGVFCQ
jgi:hypothetical protein